MFNKKSLEEILKKTVNQFSSRDFFLIEQDVNERSVSHKLAIYLQNEIDLFETGWDVDCEYNRMGVFELDKGFISKRLNLPIDKNISSDDTEAKTVYPDIIVHHRGESGSEDNLLVIEMKKNVGADKYDIQKLDRYGEELNYRFALYLNVTVASVMGIWRKIDGNKCDKNAIFEIKR